MKKNMKNFKEGIAYSLIFTISQILLYRVIMKFGEFVANKAYHRIRSRKK